MKDSELIASTKNTNKPIDPADMSLEDLLRADLAQDPKPPRRAAEGRDDEPGSGLVKLAEMVAKSAQDPSGSFQTVSSTPPPAMLTPPTGVPVSETIPAPAPPPKSSAGIIFAALVIAGAVLGGFYLIANKQQPEPPQQLASTPPVENDNVYAQGDREKPAGEELAAKMGSMENEDNARAVEAPAKAEPQKAPAETPAEDGSAGGEDATSPASDAKLDETRAEKKEARPERTKSAPREATANKKQRSQAAPKSASTAIKDEPQKKTSPAAESQKDGSEDLDALLGGPKKKARSARKPASQQPAGLSTPDRQQVKQAMAPVARKAQMCSKYSTGTIQLKLVVNNSGRVVSSKALGPFAGTNAGKCVEMLARTAKFPNFSEPSFTVNYPIILK